MIGPLFELRLLVFWWLTPFSFRRSCWSSCGPKCTLGFIYLTWHSSGQSLTAFPLTCIQCFLEFYGKDSFFYFLSCRGTWLKNDSLISLFYACKVYKWFFFISHSYCSGSSNRRWRKSRNHWDGMFIEVSDLFFFQPLSSLNFYWFEAINSNFMQWSYFLSRRLKCQKNHWSTLIRVLSKQALFVSVSLLISWFLMHFIALRIAFGCLFVKEPKA